MHESFQKDQQGYDVKYILAVIKVRGTAEKNLLLGYFRMAAQRPSCSSRIICRDGTRTYVRLTL